MRAILKTRVDAARRASGKRRLLESPPIFRSALRFLRSDDGPVAVEYSVMLALIIMMALTAITALGDQNSGFWGHINTEATAAFEAANANLPGN